MSQEKSPQRSLQTHLQTHLKPQRPAGLGGAHMFAFTEWGCGMVKDKTLVPWGIVPVDAVAGPGGSEYRFTCRGRGRHGRASQGGANHL